MVRIDQLKLYNQTTDGVRYIRHGDEKYLIAFLSENSTLLNSYSKLNIKITDVKYVSVPYTKMPRTILTSQLKSKYKTLGLNSLQSNIRLTSAQNLLYDPSEYIIELDKKYKPHHYRMFAGTQIRNVLNTGFYLYKEYKKVLLYSIDLTKPIQSNFTSRKIFPILQDLKSGEFEYDYFLFNVISEHGSRYRLLVKDRDFKFNLVWTYVKSIAVKPSVQKELDSSDKYKTGGAILPSADFVEDIPDDERVNNAVSKLAPHIDPIVKKDNVTKVKNFVSDFLKKNPQIVDKIETTDDVSSTDAQKIAIGSILDKTINNSQKAMKLIRNIEPSKTQKILSKVDATFTDKFIEKTKVASTSDNQIVQLANVSKLNDHKNPIHLFEKRSIDFKTNLQKDIESVFKVLENRDIPLYTESVILTDSPSKPGEINKSEITLATITIVDMFKNKHIIRLEIPKINTDTGVFTVNGKSKCLINQMVQCPISFPSPGDSKFESAYSTFHIESKHIKKYSYLRSYIGSFKNLPLLVVISFMFGFENSMKSYGIDYEISDKAPNKIDSNVVKINDTTFVYFKNVNTDLKAQLCNSFNEATPSRYNIDKPLLSREYFEELLQAITGTISASYHINRIFDNILDPASTQVLMIQGLPHDLDLIIKYMSEKVVSGFSQDKNDLSNQRIRGSEIIAHLIVKSVSQAYTIYRNQVLSGNKNAIFEIREKDIRSAFLTSDIVSNMEYANPVEEMAVMLRVSPIGSGIGGLKNKAAISSEYRNVHQSYFGNIDPLDTPEGGQIGVVQQLTLDAEISSTRGIFNIKEVDPTHGSGILSTSSALIPFTSSNDGNRIMFACSQQKQMLPLKNPEPPAIMTGYESILTNILTPNFVKKSPVDGIITDVTKDKISIASKDGKSYSIDLSPIHLSSGSGRDTLSIFIPKVLTHQKVREKEIVAESSSIKDGTISLGRNLLVAYMPYKGYSFDDGIIINENLVKNEQLVSLHAIVEEILISEKDRILYIVEPGTKTEKGDILLRKTIGEIEELLGFEEDETSVMNGQDLIKKSPGGVVVDIELYSNIDISKNPKLKEFGDKTRERHGTAPKEKFSVGGKLIKGILIKFKIQQELSIDLGDKMTGRYGNKGVVCYIEENSKMPLCPWGDHVDIILNPLGVISRMNVGQIYETYCGLISKSLAGMMAHNTKERFIHALKYVLPLLDGTQNKEYSTNVIEGLVATTDKQYLKIMEKIKNDRFFPIIVPPFKSPTVQSIKKALDILGLKSGYNLYLPEFDVKTTNAVPVGYLYMSKLEHIARLKSHSRSTGPVTSKTGQPTAGKRREGGQRMGELDSYSILSYNVPHLASEIFSSMSDDIKSKNEMISEIVQTGETTFRYPQVTPAKDLLSSYFLAMMLDQREMGELL